jgi:hypothetical protein
MPSQRPICPCSSLVWAHEERRVRSQKTGNWDYMTHPDIATLLNSEDPLVRAQAVFESLSLDQIERLLTDSDATVRKIAADLHRDISPEMILRVIDKFPQDISHFALHATAPGKVLGHRGLSWVGEPDLKRYLDYRKATDTQRGRMYEMWTAAGGGPYTLTELWDSAFGGGPTGSERQ